jgi:hypothetical protein
VKGVGGTKQFSSLLIKPRSGAATLDLFSCQFSELLLYKKQNAAKQNICDLIGNLDFSNHLKEHAQ